MTELDHIQRTPLPWRTETPLTECGLADTPALTVAEFVVKARKLGQQRAALVTCMTCWNQVVTYGRIRTGRDGLVDVLAREVGRVQRARDQGASRTRLEHELTAIAALVVAHRDEFDQVLAGLDEAPSLDDARRKRMRGAS